ncbi:MAG: MFS transporter [Desulfovibrionaceae bacterium]|nr:MFS transporter [Desulfovibrionaceae bacterium]
MALLAPPPGASSSRYLFLVLLTFGTTMSFQGWTLLYTNFAVEVAGLSAAQNGVVQSLREIPGLLGLLIIPLLCLFREHTLAVAATLATGIGTAIAGLFPSYGMVILTTLCMSFGFHYYEAINQSLQLQYFDLRTTPLVIGKLRGLAAGGSLLAACLVFFLSGLLPYWVLFALIGGICIAAACVGWFMRPSEQGLPAQRKKIVLRLRYRLFYALTFLAGARRQIFIAFALFLLVEKFGFSVRTVSMLFMANYAINWFLNPLLGKAINYFGERFLLSCEYGFSTLIFLGYASLDTAWIVGMLYILDYIFFNFSIALRTFFQKIADVSDIAPSMAVGQTINHISAVIIPALGGAAWVAWGSAVPFYGGMVLSILSFILVQFIDAEIRRADMMRNVRADSAK